MAAVTLAATLSALAQPRLRWPHRLRTGLLLDYALTDVLVYGIKKIWRIAVR